MPTIQRLPIYLNRWRVYALICDMGGDEFVVKIGVSKKPYQRYANLYTGLPFHSVMLHAYVGSRKKAFKLEKSLHQQFADRQTRGEWFKFKLSEKTIFHENFMTIYTQAIGKTLTWEKIFADNLSKYIAAGA
jgi:hypothetical protein